MINFTIIIDLRRCITARDQVDTCERRESCSLAAHDERRVLIHTGEKNCLKGAQLPLYKAVLHHQGFSKKFNIQERINK